jgi:hypothetical protein
MEASRKDFGIRINYMVKIAESLTLQQVIYFKDNMIKGKKQEILYTMIEINKKWLNVFFNMMFAKVKA